MSGILEGVFKGLLQWIFDLVLEIAEYISNSLLGVFNMDMSYFESSVPVIKDIFAVLLAVGWALLLGNLVFQAMRSMASGIGFEGEDPKILFIRTFVFAFLLLVSRQICNVGLGIATTVIDMLQVPSAVQIPVPDETVFAIGASWLLVIIVGFIVIWQVVRLFFEVGERYVVTAVLTFLSPLAFAMGGSKSTEDIFKGWARMFGSMCLMMVFNVIFLKMLISVLAVMPSGVEVLPWMILVVGIARVARKIDSIVARIGLNPAITGDGLGRAGLPGMLAFTVVRSLGRTVVRSVGRDGRPVSPVGGTGGKPPGGSGSAGGAFGTGRSKNNSGTSTNIAAAEGHFTASSATSPSSHAGVAGINGTQSSERNVSAQTSATYNTKQQSDSKIAGLFGNTSTAPPGARRNSVRAAGYTGQKHMHAHISPIASNGGIRHSSDKVGIEQVGKSSPGINKHGMSPSVPLTGQGFRASGQTGKSSSGDATVRGNIAEPGQLGNTRFSAVPPPVRQETRLGIEPKPGAAAASSQRSACKGNMQRRQSDAEATHTSVMDVLSTSSGRQITSQTPYSDIPSHTTFRPSTQERKPVSKAQQTSQVRSGIAGAIQPPKPASLKNRLPDRSPGRIKSAPQKQDNKQKRGELYSGKQE